MKSKFSIVAAYTKSNRGIGFRNELPWRIKEDMNWFKNITTQSYPDGEDGNVVIMGRKTWESLPSKPLLNRQNYVLSHSFMTNDTGEECNHTMKDNGYSDTKWINSINCVTDGMDKIESSKSYKYFVIGGQTVYEQTISHPECEKLYITEIDDDICKTSKGEKIVCDTFFPEIPKHFVKTQEILGKTPGVKFQIYESLHNPNSSEYQYINMLNQILEHGELTTGRNGKVLSIFGDFQHKFDLREGFPLLTTKRMPFDIIMKELLFFIRGETNAKLLSEQNVHIWDDNTTRKFLDDRNLTSYSVGDMGPMYGWNWRHFGTTYRGCNESYKDEGFDQIKNLIHTIISDPNSRRLLLTTYDPSKVHESVLAPCHGLIIQFNVSNGQYLDCKMYQRSVDTALGYPFNIASYAAFMHIISRATGLEPRYLYMTLGDTHIYDSHIEKVKRHFDRLPMKYPKLQILTYPKGDMLNDRLTWIECLKPSDFILKDYHYHPGIKMEMIA